MHRENCMCETCFQLQTVVGGAAEAVAYEPKESSSPYSIRVTPTGHFKGIGLALDFHKASDAISLASLRMDLETAAFKVLAAHRSANPERSIRTVESLLNLVFSELREGEK